MIGKEACRESPTADKKINLHGKAPARERYISEELNQLHDGRGDGGKEWRVGRAFRRGTGRNKNY